MVASTTGGTSTQSGQIANSLDWAHAIEASGGYPQTASNDQFLTAWAQTEGGNWGNTYSYNVLNTSLKVPGSSGSFIQSYQSWDQGIAATLQTLNGSSAYSPITSALAQGNAGQQAAAGNLNGAINTWDPDGGDVANLPGALANPQILGGGGPASSYSPAGVAAAGGPGNNTAVTSGGAASTGASGTGAGTGGSATAGLLSNCIAYRTSSAATTNCIIGGGGGIVSIGCIFNACNAKAMISGLIVLGGGILMLAGTVLLFADRGGILGDAAKAAGGVFAVTEVTKAIKSRTGAKDPADNTENRNYMEGFAKGQKAGPNKTKSVPADEGEF
jgi:hypothetical protein